MNIHRFSKVVCLVLIACFVSALIPSTPLSMAKTPAIKPVISSPTEDVMWYKLPLPVVWQSIPGALSYEVTVWDSLSLNKKITEITSLSSFTISSGQIPMNQFYLVCVRATFADKTVSDESARVNFYLDGGGTPAHAPEKPTLKNPMYGDSIDLPQTFRWGFQSRATSYELIIWDNLQTKRVLTQVVSSKKFVMNVKALTEGLNYYVSLRATYGNGSVSAESEKVYFYVNLTSGTPPPPPPPPSDPNPPKDPEPKNQPKILTPSPSAQIILPYSFSWTMITGSVKEYVLKFWNSSATLVLSQIVSRYSNYYSLSKNGLPPDTDYTVSVEVSFLDGTATSESEKVPFRVVDPNASTNKPIVLSPSQGQSINLPYAITWSASVVASFYQIQIFDNKKSYVVLRDTVSSTTLAFLLRSNSLITGQDYYVSITAIAKDPSQSSESAHVMFRISQPTKIKMVTENLIPNDSVETVGTNIALPQDWTKEVWGSNSTIFSYLSSGGHTGSRALKVEIKSYTSGDAKWVARSIPVTSGQSFIYSDWYQSNITSHIVIHYTKSDGTEEYQELRTAPPTSTWVQFSDSFQVPLNSVSMEIFHLINQIGWLITDDFETKPYTPTGFDSAYVSITFDDGWEYNVTTALPLLKTNQFKATYFFATTYLEKSPTTGSASVSGPVAVRLIQSEGHEIGSHSVTHPFMTKSTATVLSYEITHSKQYLESLAGTGTVTSFATPYGDYNETVVNALKLDYKSHRSVDAGYNSVDNLDNYRLKVQNLLSTTTQAEFKSWIDEAVAKKLWLVLVYHKITDTNLLNYDSRIADFTQHLTYMKSKEMAGLLSVKKINEMIPGGTPPPPPPPTTGTANFSSAPSGASVYVDNVLKGVTPFSATFPGGSYSAKFSLTGYYDSTTTFTLSTGNTTSVTATLSLVLPPPTKPEILTPANGVQIALPYTVSWSGVSNASYYTVKIWDNMTSYPKIQLSTSYMSQVIPKGLLSLQMNYSLSVSATFADGTSTESSKISFWVTETTPPPDPNPDPTAKPIILTPFNGAQVDLPAIFSWTVVSGSIDSYSLKFLDSTASTLILEKNVSSAYTSLTIDTGVIGEDKNYIVLVVANFTDGSTSLESDKIAFYVKSKTSPANKPTILTPSLGANITLPYLVKWTGVSVAVNYQIQIFNKAQSAVLVRNTVTSTIFQYNIARTALVVGQDYYISVSALAKNGTNLGESTRILFRVSAPPVALNWFRN